MKKMNSKALVLLVTIAVLLTATVGGTLAYLAASTDEIVNTFTPGKVPPHIIEELDGQVKQNVTVKNTGNVDAYIRAKIVVTWQNEGGNVYPTKPVATGDDPDYTISLNTGTDDEQWTEADGFYYYNSAVGAGLSTEKLINTCTPNADNYPEGYTLHVEILAQAIQAEPTSVVSSVWGVTVADDGTISKS